MTQAIGTLTEQEKKTVRSALPAIDRTSPEAAAVIRRILRSNAALKKSQNGSPFVSVHEVAVAFLVTDQTIRNWVDQGLLPGTRHLGRGPRRIPRSVLASAEALARPRPPVPDFSPDEVEALLSRSPRRRSK